jgi:hypothetical protein
MTDSISKKVTDFGGDRHSGCRWVVEYLAISQSDVGPANILIWIPKDQAQKADCVSGVRNAGVITPLFSRA